MELFLNTENIKNKYGGTFSYPIKEADDNFPEIDETEIEPEPDEDLSSEKSDSDEDNFRADHAKWLEMVRKKKKQNKEKRKLKEQKKRKRSGSGEIDMEDLFGENDEPAKEPKKSKKSEKNEKLKKDEKFKKDEKQKTDKLRKIKDQLKNIKETDTDFHQVLNFKISFDLSFFEKLLISSEFTLLIFSDCSLSRLRPRSSQLFKNKQKKSISRRKKLQR